MQPLSGSTRSTLLNTYDDDGKMSRQQTRRTITPPWTSATLLDALITAGLFHELGGL